MRSHDLPESPPLPVAVIGAGPAGLAAAAHLVARGFEPLVLEAGDGPGAAVHDWAVIAGILDMIPNIGSTIAGIVAALALTVSTTALIVFVIVILVYEQFANNELTTDRRARIAAGRPAGQPAAT